MTVQKRKQLNHTKPAPRGPAQVQMLQSTSESTPGGTESKRVVIDGVIFQFEEGGKQLTRIGELPSAGSSTAAQGTPTRHRLKYGGLDYRRTKRGNLVSRAALDAKRAEQARKPCRYYTKTGRCDRALTCPYQHIPDPAAAKTSDAVASGSFEDQADFIGLPGEVFSDSESDEEDTDAGDDDDEDEEDSSDDEVMGDDEIQGKRSKSMEMDTDEDDEARVMEEV
ncbi:hypothetical protein CspeluHIS016_0309280 [Cutaneotrichosporon spelunceum]|uniref:C3H1-type domain-containing protein n=1 Tax=Cutaneotrichosporon spelunceum TaxID=1672016 RepID=A0AAD3TUG9_9TREE|nr:hypothetical protein CspeluHIS016_0309280 [Cutaneotrichosporon spelunceum]